MRDTERICTGEGHTGSCSVSIWDMIWTTLTTVWWIMCAASEPWVGLTSFMWLVFSPRQPKTIMGAQKARRLAFVTPSDTVFTSWSWWGSHMGPLHVSRIDPKTLEDAMWPGGAKYPFILQSSIVKSHFTSKSFVQTIYQLIFFQLKPNLTNTQPLMFPSCPDPPGSRPRKCTGVPLKTPGFKWKPAQIKSWGSSPAQWDPEIPTSGELTRTCKEYQEAQWGSVGLPYF